MFDTSWSGNVGPLIRTLSELGFDPREWARDPYVSEVLNRVEDVGIERDFLFACGYMQATGNLTGKTWEEQVDEYLSQEDEDAQVSS